MLAIRADGYCGYTDELDMEFSEIHVNNPSLHVEDVAPREDEKERASNCYVMSLVAVRESRDLGKELSQSLRVRYVTGMP